MFTKLKIVIGVIIFLLLLAGLVFWLRHRSSQDFFSSDSGKSTTTSSGSAASDFAQRAKALEPYLEAIKDSDGDGLTDVEEKRLETDPKNNDTDGDKIFDSDEVLLFKTDPLKPNTQTEIQAIIPTLPPSRMLNVWLQYQSAKFLPSSSIVLPATSQPVQASSTVVSPSPQPAIDPDPDQDGLTNEQELQLGSDPNKADTDGDGFNDGDEIRKYHTSPIRTDTDSDGLSDSDEINTYGTNPANADTDGDSYPDGTEIQKGYNPLGAGTCSKSNCLK